MQRLPLTAGKKKVWEEEESYIRSPMPNIFWDRPFKELPVANTGWKVQCSLQGFYRSSTVFLGWEPYILWRISCELWSDQDSFGQIWKIQGNNYVNIGYFSLNFLNYKSQLDIIRKSEALKD